MKNTEKFIKILTLVTFTLSVIIIFATNLEIPFMMDDLWYSTKLYSTEHIQSLKDIIEAQTWHWFNWGGRSMAHGLLQLILMSGERFADVLNTICIFVLSACIMLVSSSSGCKYGKKFTFLTVTAGLMTGLAANWKMSMFWEAGAANYLYISVFLMLYLFCYLREADSPKAPLYGIAFWIIPLSVMAGWSNENMGPTCLILSCLAMIHIVRSGRKLHFWMIEGSVVCLAGCIMCIIAPGNQVRKSETEAGIGLLWKTFLRFYHLCQAAFNFQLLTILTLVSIIVISVVFCGIALTLTEKYLLLGVVLSWGAMILSPHYPDRATFGTMCLAIAVIISRCALIVQKKKEASLPLYLGFTVIWLKGCYDMLEFLAISAGWIK
jgi:hypothetical protein